jgi:hypothetical protein
MANPRMPATWTDRRGTARRQPTLGTVCRLEARPGTDGGVGLVWNISTGGVSMLFNGGMERGSTISGVLATSADGFSLPVTVKVTHVAPLQTGDYLIGGQFDRPIAAESIQHFLPPSSGKPSA